LSGAVAGPEFSTPIEVSASDDWGILDVTITIDGEDTLLTAAPWEIPSVLFPEGTWEIGASTRDWSGNVADAEPVVLQVGEGGGDGGDGGSGTGGSDGGDGGDDGGGTDGDAGDDGGDDGSGTMPGGDDGLDGGDDSEGGCTCRSSHGSPPALAAFVLLGLYARRRRG
jgi:MYXO-CTERM domain-containing protein